MRDDQRTLPAETAYGGEEALGERTEFEPGDKAPNDGHYIEVGEQTSHSNLIRPRKIEMKSGQYFPDTANHNRKWKKLKG